MARIRTIKPEFWQDEDMASVSSDARLLAIGLLNLSDSEGYFKAHPSLLKAAIFPYGDESLSCQCLLNELSNIGYTVTFQGSDGKAYGHVVNFTKHQQVPREKPSKIKPLRPVTDKSLINQCQNSGLSVQEQGTGNREQGAGNREQGSSFQAPESLKSPGDFQDE